MYEFGVTYLQLLQQINQGSWYGQKFAEQLSSVVPMESKPSCISSNHGRDTKQDIRMWLYNNTAFVAANFIFDHTNKPLSSAAIRILQMKHLRTIELEMVHTAPDEFVVQKHELLFSPDDRVTIDHLQKFQQTPQTVTEFFKVLQDHIAH